MKKVLVGMLAATMVVGFVACKKKVEGQAAVSRDHSNVTFNTVAEKLSARMMPKAQYDQMLNAIVQAGLQMGQMQSGPEADFAKIGPELDKALRQSFEFTYFVKMNAKTMSDNFSEKDLTKVLAFYETDIGGKWLQTTPEIIGKTMQTVQSDLAKMVPEFVKNFKPAAQPKKEAPKKDATKKKKS